MRFVWVPREMPLDPDSGLSIYSNGLLRGLLETGATGTLISYTRNGIAPGNVPGLKIVSAPQPQRMRALSLFTRLSSDTFNLKSERIADPLRQALADNPDVLVIDYFTMGWVLPVVEGALKSGARRPLIVYVSHNYEARLRLDVVNATKGFFLRQIMRHDARKSLHLERRLVETADLITANTDEDRHCYERDVPGKPVITLTPAYDGEIRSTRPIDESLPRRAIIVGAFDWIAKRTNLQRFLKVAERPFTAAKIDLLVVGRGPESFFKETAAKFPFCRFTGKVDDVKPYLAEGRIGVMPDDVGGGFKHKYLYYIFAGLAVATIRSQFAGMPLDVDHDVIACDSTEELVPAIVEAIDDIPRLEAMRQRCWQACAHEFNWSERGRRLRAAIDELESERVI